MQGRFLAAVLAALSVMFAPAPARGQPVATEKFEHSAAAHGRRPSRGPCSCGDDYIPKRLPAVCPPDRCYRPDDYRPKCWTYVCHPRRRVLRDDYDRKPYPAFCARGRWALCRCAVQANRAAPLGDIRLVGKSSASVLSTTDRTVQPTTMKRMGRLATSRCNQHPARQSDIGDGRDLKLVRD